MKEWNIEDAEKKKIEAVYEADRLRKQQEQTVKDAQTILTLLENNYVSACRDLTDTYDYMASSFKQAQDELHITDKRKKRPALDLIASCLSKDFFQNRPLVVTDVIEWGFYARAFEIRFKLDADEQEYFVRIPMHEILNSLDDVQYYLDYRFGTYNDVSWWLEIKCKALTVPELAEQIKKYFEGDKLDSLSEGDKVCLVANSDWRGTIVSITDKVAKVLNADGYTYTVPVGDLMSRR